MTTHFVQVLCNVSCNWSGEPPRYRAYVNNELFTERTWIWNNMYLEEMFQIQAAPGMYVVRYELVDTDSAELRVKNFRVKTGPATIRKNILEIMP